MRFIPPLSRTRMSPPKESTGDFVKSMVVTVLIVLLLRSLLFEPFHIPSGSMRPTLLEGDYLFVSKYAYGYSQYSFPFGSHLDFLEGRFPAILPERGDVVVFRKPQDDVKDYIKRVIGLPGDTVQMVSGRVMLNGELLDYEPKGHFVFQVSPSLVKDSLMYRETLPDGEHYRVLDEVAGHPVDNTPVFEVPEGHIFVMGDNRDDSGDSRYMHDLGYVPLENIVGRAEIIFFSVKRGHSVEWYKPWRWPEMFRDNRIFQMIDSDDAE